MPDCIGISVCEVWSISLSGFLAAGIDHNSLDVFLLLKGNLRFDSRSVFEPGSYQTSFTKWYRGCVFFYFAFSNGVANCCILTGWGYFYSSRLTTCDRQWNFSGRSDIGYFTQVFTGRTNDKSEIVIVGENPVRYQRTTLTATVSSQSCHCCIQMQPGVAGLWQLIRMGSQNQILGRIW